MLNVMQKLCTCFGSFVICWRRFSSVQVENLWNTATALNYHTEEKKVEFQINKMQTQSVK